MKRLLYIVGMLMISALIYTAPASSDELFAGCEEKDCVTINSCSIECNQCAGSGHDRMCDGITE